MRERQRARYVPEDADRDCDRHRPDAHQPDAQRLALDEGHRIVWESICLTRAQNRDDVRMLELRGDHDLALEALGAHSRRKIGRQDFHNDAAAERALLGEKHATHPAAADLALQRVSGAQRGLQLILKIRVHANNMAPALSSATTTGEDDPALFYSRSYLKETFSLAR